MSSSSISANTTNRSLNMSIVNHGRLSQRFDLIRKLGQGTYGKVQLGINKKTGLEVALKTIKKSKIESSSDLLRIKREIAIMSCLNHPHILHIYEVYENKEKIILVMEYAQHGELYDYLSEKKKLDEDEAKRIFAQISSAVFYCHKHNIVHRDLKLENILLDENNNAKIGDFGLSNVYGETLLKTFCGSPLYASPEIVKGVPYKGPEVDSWSLGVLLYTLVYGSMPFDGTHFKKLVKQISTGSFFEPSIKSTASELIHSLLRVDSARRLTIEDVVAHNWLKSTDVHSLSEEYFANAPIGQDVVQAINKSDTLDELSELSTSVEDKGKPKRVLKKHSQKDHVNDQIKEDERETKVLTTKVAQNESNQAAKNPLSEKNAEVPVKTEKSKSPQATKTDKKSAIESSNQIKNSQAEKSKENEVVVPASKKTEVPPEKVANTASNSKNVSVSPPPKQEPEILPAEKLSIKSDVANIDLSCPLIRIPQIPANHKNEDTDQKSSTSSQHSALKGSEPKKNTQQIQKAQNEKLSDAEPTSTLVAEPIVSTTKKNTKEKSPLKTEGTDSKQSNVKTTQLRNTVGSSTNKEVPCKPETAKLPASKPKSASPKRDTLNSQTIPSKTSEIAEPDQKVILLEKNEVSTPQKINDIKKRFDTANNSTKKEGNQNSTSNADQKIEKIEGIRIEPEIINVSDALERSNQSKPAPLKIPAFGIQKKFGSGTVVSSPPVTKQGAIKKIGSLISKAQSNASLNGSSGGFGGGMSESGSSIGSFTSSRERIIPIQFEGDDCISGIGANSSSPVCSRTSSINSGLIGTNTSLFDTAIKSFDSLRSGGSGGTTSSASTISSPSYSRANSIGNVNGNQTVSAQPIVVSNTSSPGAGGLMKSKREFIIPITIEARDDNETNTISSTVSGTDMTRGTRRSSTSSSTASSSNNQKSRVYSNSRHCSGILSTDSTDLEDDFFDDDDFMSSDPFFSSIFQRIKGFGNFQTKTIKNGKIWDPFEEFNKH